MHIDLQPFVDQVVNDFRDSGGAFVDKLRDDQKPIVADRIARAGELAALMIAEPHRRDEHEQSLRHVLNALQSEAAVTGFRADNAARKLLGDAVRRAAAFLLAVA